MVAAPVSYSGRRLPAHWAKIIDGLEYAFQPIVNVHSGVCFGYEALLRRSEQFGFTSIQGLFNACDGAGILEQVESALRIKALSKFGELPFAQKVKLFLNVDNRVIDRIPAHTGLLEDRLAKLGIPQSAIVFEISEQHPVHHDDEILTTLQRLKYHGLNLAIDDFGVGFSGLQLLYSVEPNYVKIDRFFISGIDVDTRKRLLLTHIVNIARVLGITVIAEGVETEREFFICKEIGCDLVQGYIVQRPTVGMSDLKLHYEDVETLSKRERRRKNSDQVLIHENLTTPVAIAVDTPIISVLGRFHEEPDALYFPVVDETGVPLGVVHEKEIKQYAYSRFGKDLLSNKSYTVKLNHILRRCPTVDINDRAEKILEVFSVDNLADCAIVTDNMRYVGLLSARSLLGVITEKNLAMARDQNPLTRMAGNTLIEEFVSESLMDVAEAYAFAYFDFDNFKPFNDLYGFRQGDRAILMFSEIMRRILGRADFLGHIGGDDFFAGFRGMETSNVEALVKEVRSVFARDVESFHDAEVRAKRCIRGEDREGRPRCFPLLGVSAAVLALPSRRGIHTTEEMTRLIASLKKDAKQSESGVRTLVLNDGWRS